MFSLSQGLIAPLFFVLAPMSFAGHPSRSDDPGCHSFFIQTTNTVGRKIDLDPTSPSNKDAYEIYQFMKGLQTNHTYPYGFVSVVQKVSYELFSPSDQRAQIFPGDLVEEWYYSTDPLGLVSSGGVEHIRNFRTVLDQHRVARIYNSNMSDYMRVFHIMREPLRNGEIYPRFSISFRQSP